MEQLQMIRPYGDPVVRAVLAGFGAGTMAVSWLLLITAGA